jgi:alkyl hydroperoxide reductase subunit AhpC
MVDAKGMPLTVRSLFILDPLNKIRAMIIYPAACGRNFDEVLRVIDSLQMSDKFKVGLSIF